MSALAFLWGLCAVTGAIGWALILLIGGSLAVMSALGKHDHRKRERLDDQAIAIANASRGDDPDAELQRIITEGGGRG